MYYAPVAPQQCSGNAMFLVYPSWECFYKASYFLISCISISKYSHLCSLKHLSIFIGNGDQLWSVPIQFMLSIKIFCSFYNCIVLQCAHFQILLTRPSAGVMSFLADPQDWVLDEGRYWNDSEDWREVLIIFSRDPCDTEQSMLPAVRAFHCWAREGVELLSWVRPKSKILEHLYMFKQFVWND